MNDIAAPTEEQLLRHDAAHPDHDYKPYRPRRSSTTTACAECKRQDVARAAAIRALTQARRRAADLGLSELVDPKPEYVDQPIRLDALSPNGVTVGQLRAALIGRNPDDRIEVLVDPRRREVGHRIRRVVVIPSTTQEDAA